MQFGDDERAAAIQIGAVLLFGMLIISMATYQATVVPNQNKEIEFNHNQEVQGQMQDLRNTVVSVPGDGNGGSVTLDLGTTYPSRTLFVNPGPPSGSLRTVGTNDANVNVSVVNATAAGETGDFWNGDARNFTTGALMYEPRYHEYQNPPTTVYEHSLLYNQFRDENLTVSDQTIVNDRQITLVTLDGNLSENGMDSASVTARPISASSNTVAVEADGGPINITVPTRLDNDTWSEALSEQYVSNGGHVAGQYYESVSGEPYGLLTIELEEGETYDLQMARVGVGSGASAESSGRYIVDVAGDGETVAPNENQTLAVEVRDRYNNPISGQQVNASVTQGGGTVTPAQQNTSSDGRATFTYEAGSSSGTAEIEANISTSGGDTKRVVFEVQVSSSGGGGGPYSISYNRTEIDSGESTVTCYSNDTCVYDVNADGDNTFTLFSETSPPVTGADVDFAHNGSIAVSGITNADTETDGNGEAMADLEATGTPADAEVYVSTPVDSATLLVRVIGTVADLDVMFSGTSNNWVHGLDNNGNRTTAMSSAQAEAIGPARVDFDGDGLTEVPHVNSSGGLELIDRNNETTGVLTSGVRKTGITTGTWQGSGESIFYASSDGNLYRTDENGNTDQVAGFGNRDIVSVGGIGDFDDDGSDEIAVVLGNNQLGVVDDDGSTYESNIQIGSNNNRGIGEPADFDGDGAERIPVVDGNNNLNLVSCTLNIVGQGNTNIDCTETEIVSGAAAKTVVAQYDWTGDGQPDLVFANTNDNNNLYYANVSGSGTGAAATTTKIGSGITIYTEAGVR
jgi:hypothetical protein